MDPMVATYGDTVLYQSNVDTLSPKEYLDDAIISFVFEYGTASLTHVYFEKEHFAPLSDIRLIPATIIKLIVDIEDSTYLESALGKNPFQEHILFAPVTDHRGNIAGQGTHWSLLIWNRQSDTFHHYDSANHSNRSHAQYTARQLYKLCTGSDNPPKMRNELCICQKNATDCGIFVIAKAYQVLCELKNIIPMHNPDDLTFFRAWILELLQSKTKNKIKITVKN